MRPLNKYERQLMDQRKAKAEPRLRPARMPSYDSWIKRQTLSGALPRLDPRCFLIDPDNMTGE